MMNFKQTSLGIALVALPCIASAGPTPEAVCEQMVVTDPSGQITMEECLCTYQVADQVLDEDIKELLFDAWYTGNNNTEKMKQLPNPKRINKQFSRMERAMKQNCL